MDHFQPHPSGGQLVLTIDQNISNSGSLVRHTVVMAACYHLCIWESGLRMSFTRIRQMGHKMAGTEWNHESYTLSSLRSKFSTKKLAIVGVCLPMITLGF